MLDKEQMKEIKRKEQSSNIFSSEQDFIPKITQKKHVKFQTSNILFNDDYVEKNPLIMNNRRNKYIFEDKIKKQPYRYLDDIKEGKNKTYAFQKKVKDIYSNNPMKIYNEVETKNYNEGEKMKYENRKNAINKAFGSDNYKRTLGGTQMKMDIDINKITNNNFNINKRAVVLNENQNKQVPYYGKKQYYVYAPYKNSKK